MTNSHEGQARAVTPELQKMLAGRALLADKFQHFQNVFHEEGALDTDLLELCRARVDVLHGLRSTPVEDTARVFSQQERQALDVAEQLAIDAHGLSDEQISALNSSLGEAAAVSLLVAVSMHDASIRLQRVLEPLNGSE